MCSRVLHAFRLTPGPHLGISDVRASALTRSTCYARYVAKALIAADRAVTGDLPAVCVRTGERADGYVSIESRAGGPSPWVALLVLLGPIGVVVLLGIALGAPGERYTVRLPYHEPAWASIRRIGTMGNVLLGAAAVTLGAGFLMAQERLGIIAAVVVGVTGLVVRIVSKSMLPRLHLDATRRWVTLSGVHPAFAEAISIGETRRSVDH
jgi:hypothetical protein